MESALGLQVLFISIVIHLSCRPYEEDLLDNVETFSLATSILCLSCGGLLLNEFTPPFWNTAATIIIFFSIISFVIYVIWKLIFVVVFKHEESLLGKIYKKISKIYKKISSIFNFTEKKDNTFDDVESVSVQNVSVTSNNYIDTLRKKARITLTRKNSNDKEIGLELSIKNTSS